MASMENEDSCMSSNQKDDVLPLKPGCQTENNSKDNDQSNQYKLWFIYMIGTFPMIAVAMNVTSTWSYLQKIDPNVSPTFFGWANFGYYCAAIATDIAVGRWMHFRASSREPLIALCFVLILSILFYTFAQGVGGQAGLSFVLVARILLGTQRGKVTIARTLISYSTSMSQRSQILANLGIFSTVGYFIGSGFQAAFAQIGERSVYIKALRLHLNLYTVPSYFIMLIAIFTTVLVFYHIKPVAKQQSIQNEGPVLKNHLIKRELFIGACLVLLFTLTNFTGSFSETLIIPFMQHQFSLTKSEAVWYGGIVFTTQAIIATLQQGNIKLLLRRFSDRRLILIGYACLCLTFVLYIPYGTVHQGVTVNNSTISTGSADNIGCPVRYHWCKTTPRIWLPQFILGAVLHATGLSFCVTLVLSLYTKAFANRNQGSILGFISAAGNSGRLIAPIASSASYVAIGPQVTFLWIFLLCSLGMVFYIAVYKSMLPAKLLEDEDTELKSANESSSVDAFYVTPV